jgi:hypothetical protein
MADEQPSLHIDTDWKKQAQEEKKRLAEKAQQEQAAKPQAAAAVPVPGASPAASTSARGRKGQREIPPASIATLAQSLMTQTLYYLTELAYQGGDPVANLDMARHNIDTLTIVEEKTANNLTDDERHALDLALHNARSRFINVASQFI